MPNPAIVLVSAEHADFLVDEFGRYARDYQLAPARSAAEASDVTRTLRDEGTQVAMFVTDTALPDATTFEAFAYWRQLVPTARRVITVEWSRFTTDAPAHRHGLASGKYDALMLMPRGARDEEFHAAICELLADWGATVAGPEVEAVRLVSPRDVLLTLEVRDFLDRMGLPHRVHEPFSEVGREIIAAYGEPVDHWPVVEGRNRETFIPDRVRDVAVRVYGNVGDIDPDTVADLAIVGAGRAGHRRLCRLRGPEHGAGRGRGGGRPGRHQLDDPQLPRLPPRHLRHAPGHAGPQPGSPLRHPVLRRVLGL